MDINIRKFLKRVQLSYYDLSDFSSWYNSLDANSTPTATDAANSLIFAHETGSTEGRAFYANGILFDITGQRTVKGEYDGGNLYTLTDTTLNANLAEVLVPETLFTREDGSTFIGEGVHLGILRSSAPYLSIASTTYTYPETGGTVYNAVGFGINAAPWSSGSGTGSLTYWEAPVGGTDERDNRIPTQRAIYEFVKNEMSVADAMEYMGTYTGAGASGSMGSFSVIPTGNCKGWTYKVTSAGYLGNSPVEVGDMVIINANLGVSAVSASDCDIIQNNIDLGYEKGQILINADDLIIGGLAIPLNNNGVNGWKTLEQPSATTAPGEYFLTVDTNGEVSWVAVTTSDTKVVQEEIKLNADGIASSELDAVRSYLGDIATRCGDATIPASITNTLANFISATSNGYVFPIELVLSGQSLDGDENGEAKRAKWYISVTVEEVTPDTDYNIRSNLVSGATHTLKTTNTTVSVREGIDDTINFGEINFMRDTTLIDTYDPLDATNTTTIDLFAWDTYTISNNNPNPPA